MSKILSTVKILRTDGSRAEHRIDTSEIDLSGWIRRMIGADLTDTVNLRDGRVMIVDDAGWETETIEKETGVVELRPVKPLKPINKAATAIYHGVCRPGTIHQIVGDVAIAWDEDFA